MSILKIAFASVLITAVAAPAFAKNGTSTGNPEWNVYRNGQLVGADPDSRVRQMLSVTPSSRAGSRSPMCAGVQGPGALVLCAQSRAVFVDCFGLLARAAH